MYISIRGIKIYEVDLVNLEPRISIFYFQISKIKLYGYWILLIERFL